jgi:hypothetical protein
MLKIQLLSVSLSAVTLNLIITNLSARAVCTYDLGYSGKVRSIIIKAMERHWQDLQQQKIYPWGTARPYDKLSGTSITLTPAFDKFSPAQKQQVITEAFAYKVTPEESSIVGSYASDHYANYLIYSSDGRIVFDSYNGCTEFTLFTEKQRYIWYNFGLSNP